MIEGNEAQARAMVAYLERDIGTGQSYESFVRAKAIVAQPVGFTPDELSESLFPFQRDIVRWALMKGRAAIFADCGMGKTLMQLEWARRVHDHTGRPVLILAPLAVAAQTVREGARFGINVTLARTQSDASGGITITNYEMLQHFDPSAFVGIVLDESSILKSYDGSTRTAIIQAFRETPYRLACTATPAPNDHMELGNHAQFLGVMSREEMLAMFFCHDGGETQSWRIKNHGRTDFWRWTCSWAVMIRKPSDLGYEDGAFVLPELRMHDVTVDVDRPISGMLFTVEAQTLQERLAARRETVDARAAACAEIVNARPGQWLIWCNLNNEADALLALIPGAVEIRGTDDNEDKSARMLAFLDGTIRVLITKPRIAGFGMNFQNCAQMAFVGLSDSYEFLYQCVRRCWRFGQTMPVDVFMVAATTEGAVVENVKRKEREAAIMADQMVSEMSDLNEVHAQTTRDQCEYRRDVSSGKSWTLHLGDCVDVLRDMPSDGLHFSVYSPPFASLYTYSASDRDMGNCKTTEDFLEHYRYAVRELFRVTMPGRLTSFHCMNLPTSKVRDGIIGLRDFRGELIRLHEDEGWIYHSEVCIWKDPVTAMQRTKALGLLHKQIKKDSCMSRQGIPDYLVTMRKPGDNPERVANTNESFPVQVWQKYASPIWMDINPSDTLQFREAREDDDERHICPLQLGVIERAIRLWSNPGDTVLSPFAGIGSEGYQAVKMGRRFIGAELKGSYWRLACRNLATADIEADTGTLFGTEVAIESERV